MCFPLAPGCVASQVAAAVSGSAIENLSNSVNEMVGQAMASAGTIWATVGTPDLTDSGSGAGAATAGPAPGDQIATILDYVAWVGLVAAGVSLLWLGVLVAASLRRGEGGTQVGRLGLVLGGMVVVGACGSLVAGLLPSGPSTDVAGATEFVQSSLWWYMGALAVASVIVAGTRMAWEQRAEPGKDLLRSLLTLIVVAGAGVTVTQMALTASDQFAVWVLKGSLECDVAADSACFGENLGKLWKIGTGSPTGPGLAIMVTIVLGLAAALTSFGQILLMLARAGIVVILAGVLPLSAAATNTEAGRAWFRRTLGWLVAWVLYKPAAALIYAVAFQLVGTSFRAEDGIVAVLTGLMLMLLALITLPVLLRLVTPAVGALAGGGGMGGALVGATAAALPMGAVAVGNRLSGGGGGGAASGADPAPAGSPPSPQANGGGTDGADPAPAGSPPSPQASTAAEGAAAGGGAAEAAGASAAAGPAAPAVAAVGATTQAVEAGKEAGVGMAQDAAGSGPSGSGDPGRAATAPGGSVGEERESAPTGSAGGAGGGGNAAGAAASPSTAQSASGSTTAGAAAGQAVVGGARMVIDAAPQNVVGQQEDQEEGPSGSR